VIESLDPASHPWMTDWRTREVMRVLTENGGEARFVGGAVRNALLGTGVTDIDIATPLVPDEIMRRLQEAGLGAVPTGIEHGTVTAVAQGRPFEVTTLRRDVATDGRHATVAFTADWREDASRRDFTMNALYTDEEGAIFDYFGGVADLRAGRVRFVGDPKTRIREDYLRILRLFRFHAWYGRGEIDTDALAAAVAEKSGLKSLSGERIRKEVLRLLEANDPVPVLGIMIRTSILAEILPPDLQLNWMANLAAIERERNYSPDPLLRLAALLPSNVEVAANVAGNLRFSNRDRDRMIGVIARERQMGQETSEKSGREHIYNFGAQGFRDALMLRWAHQPAQGDQWGALEELSRSWTKPQFPLDGGDVKALGVEVGPRIGALLRELELWWVAQDFRPDRDALLARLRDAATGDSV
jgi:poly(A) polymerase